ncbi:ABC transporter substrate-binding protein [Alkalicoccobacillus porphyridii]|uniref:Extracellular solute-binding protein n=1 Tax=Alkalicoccobacillus porphyridii TaxID=2597270 RepID=A0A554A2K6_9BACI|nr:extracellular solute-binding protein [Alkalicoccobacillus porphyridii]TSB47886.1 extracellular solute-binding protein [Alkalicoccobacillus porphyridii]
MNLSNKWFVGVSLSAIVLVTGCSNEGSGDGDSDQTTIRVHHWYNEEQDNWDEVFAAYEEETGIKIESVTPENNDANETLQQIDLAAASGDQLDVIMVNDAANYSQRISQGMFEPLNDYLDEAGIQYEDDYQNDTSVDNQYYALPGKYNQSFVMLNEDALDEAGLDIPVDWTWDDYMDYAEALTEGEGSSKRYGTFFHTWVDYVKLAAMNQSEQSNLVQDDGVTSNINSDIIRQSLEIRQRGIDEGSATPHADTISLDLNYRPQFFSESAAMIMTGSWMINEAGGRPEEPSTFRTAFAPYPKANDNDPITTPAGLDFLTVYSGSDHKQEAFDFIRWYTTEGILDQGMYYPDYKNADIDTVLDNLLDNTPNIEMVNRDSLQATLEASEPADMNIPVPYIGEVVTAYMNETDRFLLEEQDLETTIERAEESVQQVIDNNAN